MAYFSRLRMYNVTTAFVECQGRGLDIGPEKQRLFDKNTVFRVFTLTTGTLVFQPEPVECVDKTGSGIAGD